MDLSYTPEQEATRHTVRRWLKANLPPRERTEESLEYGDLARTINAKAWQRKLYAAGYVAMGWPKESGGQGADVMTQTIINEELVMARAPGLIGMMGVQMVGPTLMKWGTEEQQRRYLPKILTADEIWCQGYSEPGSGSDLASLKTRAELVGDEFIINGQKVWTSSAQIANWMFCLVRTDSTAPKHRGISYVLIDMKTPGITVRPLIQMTGDAGFNEVFFEEVRVPRKNLVGELNQGWQVANSTLAHERNMLGSTTRSQQMFNGVLRLAQSRRRSGRRAVDDPVIRQRLADLAIRVESMKLHSHRQLTDAMKGRAPGIAASVNKLVSTELNHDMASLALDLLGSYGPLARAAARVVDRGIWPWEFMFTLGMIIGGGTSQIQKNIISERGLGMPRQ
ncbi:MAG: acyl-CoA dehydrogenase family protein [Deltaproteobacteria bacterium]|nr:acyl-CoA dehydrogenase family protein [Deltaproteobacteria bacterium]MBI3390694.1 acyl-CoA dehydrogenase family protein [Deltaproteobacteria bacterium]